MARRFNPHPARKPGATPGGPLRLRRADCFNPHPARKPGATGCLRCGPSDRAVSILTRPESRVLQPDAETVHVPLKLFQSSPGPKAGCYGPDAHGTRHTPCVSILTRPESRVLLAISSHDAPVALAIFGESATRGQAARGRPCANLYRQRSELGVRATVSALDQGRKRDAGNAVGDARAADHVILEAAR